MVAAGISEKTGIRERFVTIGDEPMFVREAGKPGNPAILLLHDLAMTSATFEPLMELLSGRYHLVAPDFIGFGRSAKPPHASFDYHFPRLGSYASAIMTDDLGIENYAVYAQGSAGAAGLGAFYEVKTEITALIMQSTAWSIEGLDQILAAHTGDQPLPEAVSRLLAQFWANSRLYLDAWSHAIASYDMDVLVLSGERDEVVSPSNAGDILSILPGAKTVTLDSGHDVLAERTPEVAHEIDAFLSRLRS